MPTREEKKQARLNKLATITHRLFGSIVTAPAPGTVFNPLCYLADPGRFKDVMWWWRYKASRALVGYGLQTAAREALLDLAEQDTLQVFLDRDYKAAGITDDEPTRAVMGAAAFMRRGYYRLPQVGDQPRRRDYRMWFPYNRALNAGTPNPAAVVATSFNAAEDREALCGACDDAPGKAVSVPGGPGGRGLTDGHMERTEVVVREWCERDHAGEMQEYVTTETGYRMSRKRGRARKYPPCVVIKGKPMPRNRHKPEAPAMRSIPAMEGDGTAWRASDPVWQEVSPGHYVSLRGQ